MLLVCIALQVFVILVFLRIVLSWFPPTGGLLDQISRLVFTATEWLMGPLRRVIPPVRLGAAALDLSPMIVIFGVILLRGAIC